MTDEDDHTFLTMPGALLTVGVVDRGAERRALELRGNRAGILSLANILLWLEANAWRREFLSISGLPFVEAEGRLSLMVRCAPDDPA